jgi:hypothetical protein
VGVRCTKSKRTSDYQHSIDAPEIHFTLGAYTVADMDNFRNMFLSWVRSGPTPRFESHMRASTIFEKILLPGRQGQGPVVRHELEHLRRTDEEKCTGAQGDWPHPFLPNEVETRDFTTCTNFVYNHLISQTTFLQDLREKSKSILLD